MRDYEANLRRFSDMEDVEVSKDDPDPRGWDVIGADGRKLGEVKDLLVDTTSMKVRSLEVELEGSTFNWNDNRRVALPADDVRLDEERDKVVLEGIGYDDLGRMDPFAYPYGSASRGSETSSSAAYGQPGFDETRGLGTAGERGWTGSEERSHADDFESGIAGDRLTRSEDEVEFGKREELVAGKQTGEDTETIETDVRKERFDIKDDDNLLDERGRRRKGGI